MYEYIAEFERWKKLNKNYRIKYEEILNFVNICQTNCKNSSNDNESCLNLCKKPLIDIERFNAENIKKLNNDVYDVCNKKIGSYINTEDSLDSVINKMKICVEGLYRENEGIVKNEIIERMNDIIKFLK